MRTFPPTHRSVHQGRRPSVAATTERRFPSARRRPGAGFLPARASAARVSSPGPRDGRFQIYGEDEFFSGVEIGPDGVAPLLDASGEPAVGLRAICCIAVAGVSLALILVVALNAVVPIGAVRRKTALRAARAQAGDGGERKLDRRSRRRSHARPRSRRPVRVSAPTPGRRPRTVLAGSAQTPAAVGLHVEVSGSTHERLLSEGSSASDVSATGGAGRRSDGVQQETDRGEFGFER